MLSDEEKLNLWKSFPDYFDENDYEDEDDYPTLDDRWSKYYSQSKVVDSSIAEGAHESFDPIEKEIYEAIKNNRTNIL